MYTSECDDVKRYNQLKQYMSDLDGLKQRLDEMPFLKLPKSKVNLPLEGLKKAISVLKQKQ